MNSVIFPASKSLSVSDRVPNENIKKNRIIVGYDGKDEYISFLFFDISSLPPNIILTNCELVLFKCDNFYDDENIVYNIYPLYDYFSIYTDYSNIPDFNEFNRKSFKPMTSKVSININITNIVSTWIKNSFSNKGIILCDPLSTAVSSFGSSYAKKEALVPFLVLAYKTLEIPKPIIDCNHDCTFELSVQIINNFPPTPPPTDQSLIDVIVVGTAPPGTTIALIIKLTVKRITGTVDKYYQSDEFKTIAGNIYRTYKIPVVPALGANDILSGKAYASYKSV